MVEMKTTIGSLTAEHKASLVFSDIKYRQNIAGR